MAFRSTSHLAGSSSTSAAIPVPVGAAVDDIAIVGLYKESTAAVAAPSGFTEKAALTTSGASRGTLYVYWKRLTAADTGSYTFSWTGGTWRAGACALFSGRTTTGDPFDGAVGTAESTVEVTTLNVSTSPAAASGDAVGMWTDFTGGNTWTAPTNYTERQDIDVITLDTRDAVASGTTGSVSATANVSGFMKAFLGVLTVASSGTTHALGLATETDIALTTTATKASTLGLTTETDSASALNASKANTLSVTTETDQAFSLATAKTVILGFATETDDAFALTTSGGLVFTLSLATETDTAFGLTLTKASALGLATETDSSAALSAARTHALGLASETNQTFTIAVSKTHVLDLSTETDQAFSLTLIDPRDITVIADIRNNHVTGGVVLSDLIAGLRSNHVTGGVDVPRNLRTGSVEYVTAEVTFVGETAASIATATGQVQVTTTDTTPTAGDPNWAAPDVTDRTDVTGGAKLSLSTLHTAGAAATYRLWAKVTDNPEVPILLCGSFDVRA